MAKYLVKVAKAPKGHSIPQLLTDFGEWLKKQEHGSLGWFDGMMVEAIPKEWDEENAKRLQDAAFVFLTLGEGSMLTLFDTGVAKAPSAVVLLGSEGDRNTIATSLEEFLALWSKGETGVMDLDDEEVEGRAAIGKWLKEKKIKAPKAKDFDFQAWLDGGQKAAAPKAAVATKPIKRKPTAVMKKLGPKMQKVASLLGARVDDPDVVAYFTKTLAKKLPQATSERSDDANVVAPKAGLEFAISHKVLNDDYPPIHKTAKSFIPYITYAWVHEKIGEPILGVPWKVTSGDEVIKVLGKPHTMRGVVVTDKEKTTPVWTFTLDDGAHTELEISFRKHLRVSLSIITASELNDYQPITTGLFLGWAATNKLLDESRFVTHGDLLDQVKKKKAKGSDLLKAMGRGLWDDHLKKNDELRAFAYLWFHNMENKWITADLKKVFGKRVGPYDHDEPKLDEDSWDAVAKASPIFKERFKAWLK